MADNTPIPNFEIPDEEVKFPEGWYLCALGGIRPVYNEGEETVAAVVNDIWILKYMGTDLNPVQDVRITFKEGKPVMGVGGVRIVERYPNPAKMPNMAWRARAFFSKFDAITEVEIAGETPSGKDSKRLVDWAKVQAAFGTVFKMCIIYQKAKSGGKTYRNIDYESIELLGQKVSSGEVQAIEEKYKSLKAQDEARTAPSGETTPGLEDLPF